MMRNVGFVMPVIDMTGFDTQLAPMKAIDEVLTDLYGGFINNKEALGIINAIVCEWKH
jgi:hypothetical protein